MAGIYRLIFQKKKPCMMTITFAFWGIFFSLLLLPIDSRIFAVEDSPTANFGNSTVLLRLAHGTTLDHPTHAVTEEIAKEIYTKTSGKIQLEIYENMQFGQEIELVNMVLNGKLDIAIVSAASLSSFDYSVNIIELPYLFNSEAQANQALDGEPGQAVLNSLSSSGLIGICYWENGFRSITTRDRQVKKPEDLIDLHIRVMQNPIHIAFFSKMGTVPTPMEWGEVIPALRSKIIEAQENPIPIVYTNHLGKYQQYLILTEHIFDPHVILTSYRLPLKLTTDELNLIYSLFRNARFKQRRLVEELKDNYRGKLKESGMTIIKPEIGNFRRLGREFSKEACKMFEPGIRTYFERYLQ
jgi:tripartite ATP-independent transporter DctP family solute receptor